MLVELAMGFSGLVQRERTGHMDFKRAGLDQAIEFLNLSGIRLTVVTLDLYPRGRLWGRHYAVWMRHAPVVAHSTQGAIGAFTTSGDECGIQTARGECTRPSLHVLLATVHYRGGAHPASGDECGTQPARGKCPRLSFHVIFATVHYGVGAKSFYQRDAILP